MSERFQVGDIVECIDAAIRDGTRLPPRLILGGLYTIENIGPDAFHAAVTMLYLKEMLAAEGLWPVGTYGGNYPDRFRKIHRPRAEFLTELLTAPVDVREDA